MEARSAREIWEAALGALQLQVSTPNYRTWLHKTVGLSYQDNQFVIGVPSIFVAEYLDKKQRSLIENTLIGLTKPDIYIVFQVAERPQNQPSSYGSRKKVPSARQTASGFNPKYTFDSFIAGKNNRLALNAALGVADDPSHSDNPLFIYGGTGLGKTHLLQAIGHKALANHIQVLYVSAEQFTNELMDAIRDRRTDEFRNKYRSVEMLLVDDIQFIGGKRRTEESFFYTFNELHNANRQMAIASDRSPKSIPLLNQQLQSRLKWGLIVDIQPPDFESRLEILKDKAKQRGVNVTPDVLDIIASQMQQSIREMEGALNRVIAYAKLLKALLTPELAFKALEDIASKEPKGVFISPASIIETVAKSFQLTPLDLRSRKRNKEVSLARQVAIYLIKQETDCSLTQIGREFGGRDHHVITNAYKTIGSNIRNNPALENKISHLRQSLSPTNY